MSNSDSGEKLARATALLTFYTVTIQGDRTITYILPDEGIADSLLDFEAVASHDEAYRFVWNFDDGTPELTDTPAPGQSSKVSHDYKGLKDGDIFRPQVELRSLDGQEVLAKDSVRFDVARKESDDSPLSYDCGWSPDYSTLEKIEIDESSHFNAIYHVIPSDKSGLFRPVYHGLKITWWDSDRQRKRVAGCYYEGERHGRRTEWYEEEGTKRQESHYRHGKRHGIHTSWDATGIRRREVEYYENKKHGRLTEWDEAGIKVLEKHYRHGEKHGSLKRWSPKGIKTVQSNYYEGKQHGKRQTWNGTTGKPQGHAHFKHGKLHGEQLLYFIRHEQPAAKYCKRHYREGVLHGPYEGYDMDSGLVKERGQYENGNRTGQWIFYNLDGSVNYRKTY